MTDLLDALTRLRSAVAGTAAIDEPVLLAALDSPAFETHSVTSAVGGGLSHVVVAPLLPVELAPLEAQLGPSKQLPRGPAIGARRMLLFPDTLPTEGEVGATVLAELDEENGISRLMVRRDAY